MRIRVTVKFSNKTTRKFSVGTCAAKGNPNGVTLLHLERPTKAKAIYAVRDFCSHNKSLARLAIVSIK